MYTVWQGDTAVISTRDPKEARQQARSLQSLPGNASRPFVMPPELLRKRFATLLKAVDAIRAENSQTLHRPSFDADHKLPYGVEEL